MVPVSLLYQVLKRPDVKIVLDQNGQQIILCTSRWGLRQEVSWVFWHSFHIGQVD
jgi:hypothetical protein